MKNLKVGKKLLVGFGIVSVLFLLSTSIGVGCLLQVSNNFQKFYEQNYQIVNAQNAMRRDLQAMFKDILWSATTTDTDLVNGYLDEAQSLITDITDVQLPIIRENYTGDTTKLDSLEQALAAGTQLQEDLFKLCRGHQIALSLNYFNNTYAPIMLQAQDLMIEIGNTAAADADITFAHTQTTRNLAVMLLIAVILVSFALIILAAVKITRALTQPLIDLESAADEMAKGSFAVDIVYESNDEIGALSESMRSMAQLSQTVITDLNQMLASISGGNFAVESTNQASYIGEFKSIRTYLNKLLSDLSATIANIDNVADRVFGSSGQVSSGAQALSQGATEQASAIEQLAATINDISGQVQQTAHHAAVAREENEAVHTEIQNCNTKMQQLVHAMTEIDAKSEEIGKVVKTIEDIAFQTNILALNAAVEAARAGVAGKGFAVVADEVRNLAAKSGDAAKNTTFLIEDTVRAVQAGAELSTETQDALAKVVQNAQKVYDAVVNIADATHTQATQTEQVSQGIDQISAVVQTTSATAEQAAAASETLTAQARTLKSLTGQFILQGTTPAQNQMESTLYAPSAGQTEMS